MGTRRRAAPAVPTRTGTVGTWMRSQLAQSPLAQSAAARLGWTGAVCALLWLAVWWALS